MTVNQTTLKVGDRVRVKNGKGFEDILTEGSTYTVQNPRNRDGFIELREVSARPCFTGWSEVRFELAKEFKVGDRVLVTAKYKHSPWVGGDMEDLIGKSGVIRDLCGNDSGVSVLMDGDEWSPWYIHPEDLDKEPVKVRPDLEIYGLLQTLGNAKKVTLVSTAGVGEYKYLGYIQDDSEIHAWNIKGDSPPGTHYRKIENVPKPKAQPKEIYINVNKGATTGILSVGGTYSSRENADAVTSLYRVSVQKVTLVEGQFDS